MVVGIKTRETHCFFVPVANGERRRNLTQGCVVERSLYQQVELRLSNFQQRCLLRIRHNIQNSSTACES